VAANTLAVSGELGVFRLGQRLGLSQHLQILIQLHSIFRRHQSDHDGRMLQAHAERGNEWYPAARILLFLRFLPLVELLDTNRVLYERKGEDGAPYPFSPFILPFLVVYRY